MEGTMTDAPHPYRFVIIAAGALTTRVTLGAMYSLAIFHDPEIAKALQVTGRRIVDILAARIDQGRRDGDVSLDVDARATAEFFLNTTVGLRILAKTHEAAALYRIIDVALTTL